MYDVLLMVPLKAKLKILSVLCCQKGGTLIRPNSHGDHGLVGHIQSYYDFTLAGLAHAGCALKGNVHAEDSLL